MKQLCRICLRCIGKLESKISRPLREELYASRRNQVMHYDLLFVKNTDKFFHVLVDLSHSVELVSKAQISVWYPIFCQPVQEIWSCRNSCQ